MFALHLAILVFATLHVSHVRSEDDDSTLPSFYLPVEYNQCEYSSDTIPEPRDCRIFYECNSYSQMVYSVCPVGSYYHPENRQCGSEKPIGCQTSWYPLPPSTTTEKPPSTTTETVAVVTPQPDALSLCQGKPNGFTEKPPSTTTETVAVVTPQPDALSLCQGKPNGFTYRVQTNCRSYAVCWQGKSHEGECPKGFSYNGESSICDISQNFRCETDHFCPPHGIHLFQKRGSCVEYNLCFVGVHMVKQCLEGLHFDASQNRCASPAVAQCNDCPVVDDPLTIVTFASQNESEYYICQAAELVRFKCAEGLRWNQEAQQCDTYPAESTEKNSI